MLLPLRFTLHQILKSILQSQLIVNISRKASKSLFQDFKWIMLMSFMLICTTTQLLLNKYAEVITKSYRKVMHFTGPPATGNLKSFLMLYLYVRSWICTNRLELKINTTWWWGNKLKLIIFPFLRNITTA